MRININVLDKRRADAEARVNVRYIVDGHDIAHDRKRTLAQAIVAGQQPTAEFIEAATIEGVTPTQLAQTIVGKPDELMAKENKRRSIVVRVRNAKTVDELNAIMAEVDLPDLPGMPHSA